MSNSAPPGAEVAAGCTNIPVAAKAVFRPGVKGLSRKNNDLLSDYSAPVLAIRGANVHCNAVDILLVTDGGETVNRILRLPEVIRVSGLARSTIYLRMKEKTFPTQIKLATRSVGWLETSIQNWIDLRISESREEGDQNDAL